MQQKPPPIQWIPAFEAAARHQSFKRAAQELHVTPPAVSQQIKNLEDYLGLTLFDRGSRNLRLTRAGQSYFEVARNIMLLHQQGYRDFERTYHNPLLQISSPIFIAQELLIPNYMTFKDFAPGVELRLTTGNEYVDFENDSVDAALRFGAGDWPELDCRLVSDVVPRFVCSPDYLKKCTPSDSLYLDKSQLEHHVVLSVYDDLRDWHEMVPGIQPRGKMICDSYFSVIRAAEEGLGIGIGLLPVINRLITHQRLVILPGISIDTDFAYWLVSPAKTEEQAHIDGLYRWIQSLFKTLE